jgi:hypothetical protein
MLFFFRASRMRPSLQDFVRSTKESFVALDTKTGAKVHTLFFCSCIPACFPVRSALDHCYLLSSPQPKGKVGILVAVRAIGMVCLLRCPDSHDLGYNVIGSCSHIMLHQNQSWTMCWTWSSLCMIICHSPPNLAKFDRGNCCVGGLCGSLIPWLEGLVCCWVELKSVGHRSCPYSSHFTTWVMEVDFSVGVNYTEQQTYLGIFLDNVLELTASYMQILIMSLVPGFRQKTVLINSVTMTRRGNSSSLFMKWIISQ